MSRHTRRQFLQAGAATLAYGSALLSTRQLLASPFGLPLGLQLYSVREMLPKDYEGTLRQIAALGYREVEAAGFFHHTAAEVKQAMSNAGLRCVSAHYPSPELQANIAQIIDFHKELGAEYIICSSPGFKDPSKLKNTSHATQVQSITMDDWHWNAEQFNRFGEQVKAAGLKFGYHNHIMEFRAQSGAVPFDELIRLTEPSLVTFEMDCGWVIVGGGNPVDYLHRYPDRISMLHVKDFKRPDTATSAGAPPPAAELGRGTIDYRPIFKAAKKGEIKHYFVEQEGFDMPPFEALKIDADYMKNLTV
jgi:sugar phosphate isomerase/epimerase